VTTPGPVRGDALLDPLVTRTVIEAFTGAAPPAAPAPRLDELTVRRPRCCTCWARGGSNAEIAADLFVGEATVETHVARMLMKLGLRDRAQGVVHAYEHGLVRPGDG
jgi:DNA-binding NarL/FixJ family response regulator